MILNYLKIFNQHNYLKQTFCMFPITNILSGYS